MSAVAEITALLAQLSADELSMLHGAVLAHMVDARVKAALASASAPQADELLDAEQTAAFFGKSVSWVHHRKDLPRVNGVGQPRWSKRAGPKTGRERARLFMASALSTKLPTNRRRR